MSQYSQIDYRVRLYQADSFLNRLSDLKNRQDNDLTSQTSYSSALSVTKLTSGQQEIARDDKTLGEV